MHNTFWFATEMEQWDGWLRETVALAGTSV